MVGIPIFYLFNFDCAKVKDTLHFGSEKKIQSSNKRKINESSGVLHINLIIDKLLNSDDEFEFAS